MGNEKRKLDKDQQTETCEGDVHQCPSFLALFFDAQATAALLAHETIVAVMNILN